MSQLSLIFHFAALLSGTLRTIQRAACDGETLTLRCPLGTAVSIQLAQYGRPAPGVALCSQQQHPPDPPALTAVDGNQLQTNTNNDTCTLTPQMQVRVNPFSITKSDDMVNHLFRWTSARVTSNRSRSLHEEETLQIHHIGEQQQRHGCCCSSFSVMSRSTAKVRRSSLQVSPARISE